MKSSKERAAFSLARSLGACLLAAVALANCHSSKSKEGGPVGPAAPSSTLAAWGGGGAGVGAADPHDHPDHAAAGGEGATVASPSALSADARAQLTTLLVSAHVGIVIARKEADGWVISGQDGCTIAPARVKRALDNLMSLKAVPTTEAVPEGAAFQLQISALVGEKRVVHLELAGRNANGDLARLDSDAMVRIQGLARDLWSPNPADWCRGP